MKQSMARNAILPAMALLEKLSAEPVPLTLHEEGIMRVGRTRVRLDMVIGAYNAGASAEEILLKYPTLALKDIHGILAYYHWHPAEIDAYLADRQQTIDMTRADAERRFPSDGVRARLLARKSDPQST